jgi:hypothetical protein
MKETSTTDRPAGDKLSPTATAVLALAGAMT